MARWNELRLTELRGEVAGARIVVARGATLLPDVALHFADAIERVLDLCDTIDAELAPWVKDGQDTVTVRIRAALLAAPPVPVGSPGKEGE